MKDVSVTLYFALCNKSHCAELFSNWIRLQLIKQAHANTSSSWVSEMRITNKTVRESTTEHILRKSNMERLSADVVVVLFVLLASMLMISTRIILQITAPLENEILMEIAHLLSFLLSLSNTGFVSLGAETVRKLLSLEERATILQLISVFICR